MAEQGEQRRGLVIFQRGAERRPAMSVDETYKQRTMAQGVPEAWFDHGGAQTNMLYMDADGAPSPGTVILAAVRYGPNYKLPRHAHTTGDCLYYVSEGEIRVGNRVMKAGDGFFAPNGAPYTYECGPEGAEVLEFKIYQPSPAGQPSTIWSESPAGWEKIIENGKRNHDTWVQVGLKSPAE